MILKVTRKTADGPVVDEVRLQQAHNDGVLTVPAQGFTDEGDLSGPYVYKVKIHDVIALSLEA